MENWLLVYYKSSFIYFIEDLNETTESYKVFGVNISQTKLSISGISYI